MLNSDNAIIIRFVVVTLSAYLIGLAQKPTLSDVVRGQQKIAVDQVATKKDVDDTARTSVAIAQEAQRRSSANAVAAAVQAYKDARDQEEQIRSLTTGLLELQKEKADSELEQKEERKRVADAALAAHADTISKLKGFGFAVLGLLISGIITMAFKYRSDREHHNGEAKALRKIYTVVDGEKTAEMKTTLASLRAQLAQLRKLSPESVDVIQMLETQIEDRDTALVQRARDITRADFVNDHS